MLLLCDLFHKTKNILSKNDRNDIITYAKTQLPAFLTQLTDLVIILKDIFTTISPAQTKAIASFLASEVPFIKMYDLKKVLNKLSLDGRYYAKSSCNNVSNTTGVTTGHSETNNQLHT